MREGWLLVAGCLWLAVAASGAAGQIPAVRQAAAQDTGKHVCECGAHPPSPPKDREVEPYAGEPEDLSPYEKFAKPYFLNYTHPNIYTGAGRDIPEPKNLTEVRIGFFGPIEHSPELVFGTRMLHGAQLAVEEAQALQADAAQRLRQLAGRHCLWQRPPHGFKHLGLAVQRNHQDGLRRSGLGHLRIHQFRVNAHCVARRTEG